MAKVGRKFRINTKHPGRPWNSANVGCDYSPPFVSAPEPEEVFGRNERLPVWASRLAAYETGEEWTGFRCINVSVSQRNNVRSYCGD
jgi:hypothetical protein